MRGIYHALPLLAITFPAVLYAQIIPVSDVKETFLTASDGTAALPAKNVTEPRTALSLDEAIRMAQAYIPVQRILATRQDLRQAEMIQSNERINPELLLSSLGLKADQQEQSFAVSQRLDVFGVRHARQALAKTRLETEQVQQDLYQHRLRLLVMAAYRQVILAEQQLSLSQQQQALSDASVSVAEKRYAAGRIAEVELNRLKISQLQAKNETQTAAQELVLARQSLTRFWGNTAPVFTATIDRAWVDPDPVQLSQSLDHGVLQALNQQAQKESVAALKLAQTQAYGMPSLSVGMRRVTDPSQSNYSQVTVGVSIPLPFFSRNQGAIQTALVSQRLISEQTELSQIQRRQSLNRLLAQLESERTRYKAMTQEQLPQAYDVQKKMLQGFTAGKFNVMDIQQTQRDLLQLEQNSQHSLANCWQLRLQIEALITGLPIDSFPSNPAFADSTINALTGDATSTTSPLLGATP